jgi:hypothetical protein
LKIELNRRDHSLQEALDNISKALVERQEQEDALVKIANEKQGIHTEKLDHPHWQVMRHPTIQDVVLVAGSGPNEMDYSIAGGSEVGVPFVFR